MRLTTCVAAALTLSAGRAAPQEAPTWEASYFPLAAGDVWIYRETTDRAGGRVERIRLKAAVPSKDGIFRLEDPDGDDYLFSSDERGLLLHGEVKPDGEEVTFAPPFEYANPRLLASGESTASHDAGGRSLRSVAKFLGRLPVRAPGIGGESRAIVTSFEYSGDDGRSFTIVNHLVRGVGPARRSFQLRDPNGRTALEVTLELLAARVGGKIFPESDPSALARLAFQHAFEHREVWGAGFSGLTAEAVLRRDGEALAAFSVALGAKGEVAALEPRGDEGPDRAWAEAEIRSLFRHRRGGSFEERHGAHRFSLVDAPAGTIGVRIEGDAMGSHYEVSGGVIRAVSRVDEEGRRFRIDVRDVRWTPGGRYLPVRFDVTHFDRDGAIRETAQVTDEYAERDGHWIPTSRVVESGGVRRVLAFEATRLGAPRADGELPAEAAARR